MLAEGIDSRWSVDLLINGISSPEQRNYCREDSRLVDWILIRSYLEAKQPNDICDARELIKLFAD